MAEIVKVAGISMVLNGKEYVIPPLSLGALDQLKDRVGQFDKLPFAEQVTTTIDAAHAALKRNYPELTHDDVGELVDVGNMMDVFQALMDVSGMQRRLKEAQSAGEVPAAG